MAQLGVQHVHSRLRDVHTLRPIEVLGEKVVPQIAEW
jgi:hypothetical protein